MPSVFASTYVHYPCLRANFHLLYSSLIYIFPHQQVRRSGHIHLTHTGIVSESTGQDWIAALPHIYHEWCGY